MPNLNNDYINTNMNTSKTLSIVIPAYNSQDFLSACLDSLVEAGNDLEVIVVNDGSKDNTLNIAKDYQAKYPNIIRAIDQENKGWGGAINNGIDQASGEYLFVVDSDDHLDTKVLAGVLSFLRHTIECNISIDLLITNYIYDHVSSGESHPIRYRNLFPSGRLFGWDEVSSKPKIDEYLMIHGMTYRTQLVRDHIGKLPTNVSYMDSLLCLRPLPYVDTLFYLDVDLYYYQIGRAGQTIDVNVIKKHMDEQYLAARLSIEALDYRELASKSQGLADCASRYLNAILTVSCIYTFMLKSKNERNKLKELWSFLKQKDPQMYDALKGTFARKVNRKTPIGRFIALTGYAFARKVFKFA